MVVNKLEEMIEAIMNNNASKFRVTYVLEATTHNAIVSEKGKN